RRGHRGWRGDQAHEIRQATGRARQLFEQRSLLFQDLAARTGSNETTAWWIGRGSDADDQRARAGMRIDNARARTRATLIVQDLEPFAIIQLAQRVDGDALETPHVYFRTMTERRVFEGHSKALGSGFILERFSFECGAQWRGETTPA